MKNSSLDLKTLREKRKLTQAEFAQKLGIERSHLSRLENGKREIRGPVKVLLERMGVAT